MFNTSKRIAAVLIAGSLASSASAAIIHYAGPDIPIPTTWAGVSVDFELQTTTNDLIGAPGMDLNFALGGEAVSNDADATAGAPEGQFVRTGTGITDPIDNLTVGTEVGPSSVYASDFGGSTTHIPTTFANGTQGYIGFQFLTSTAATAYGWARVTFQDDGTPGVIHGYAHNNSGTILVGTIPEPSLALLSSIGLAALAFRRRR